MAKTLTNELKSMEIFQTIKDDTIYNIAQISKVIEYSKNDIVFSAKEKSNFVYFLLKGKAIIYNMTHNGNRKIIFILGKGNLLSFNIINDNPTSIFCETIEQSKILCIKKSEFLKLMEIDFSLTETIINEYEKYMCRMSHQLKNTIGNIYIQRKIAAKLWKLARDFGIETKEGKLIDIDITITFMADLIGAPRESVSRACKKLSDMNLVRFENKRFTVLDIEKLAKYYKNLKSL